MLWRGLRSPACASASLSFCRIASSELQRSVILAIWVHSLDHIKHAKGHKKLQQTGNHCARRGILGETFNTAIHVVIILWKKMATVPSEIYPHIYSFLLQNKFVKTAKSFKKEALVVSTLPGLVISLT